jgi:ABC-type uncharacterized transport system involved in gliding motility auxiliary subunit
MEIGNPVMASPNKRKYASNTLLYAVFVTGVIVLVNVLSTRVFGRIDLTEKKIYTLSQSSKDLVKNLPDHLSVKIFMSKDLPPELKTNSRYARDLIDEYASSSSGKFRWEAIDPGEDAKLKEEASRCKVQPIQVQVLRSQKFELGSYYLGLCLEYGSEVESLPQIAGAEGLEYQISSLIKRMTQKKRKLAFTTGHGESDTNQGFQALKQDLEQEYDVSTVDPSTAEIGADIDALIVGGPKQAIDDKGQREIDKFVMRGRGVVFLVDGMDMAAPRGANMGGAMNFKVGQANETGLGGLLASYGFKIAQNFVFEARGMPGPVDVGGRPMLVNAPFFVGARTEPAKGLSVLEGIRGLVFPYASSVELVGPLGAKPPQGAKLWPLASSSPQSWEHTGFFMVTPDMKIEEGKTKKAFSLGFAYEGPLQSAFPADAPGNLSVPPGQAAAAGTVVKRARVVVVGDSDFAHDQYVQLARFIPIYGAGAQLLFNAISWTVEDEALTPLRSKSMQPRPIQVESASTAVAVQWGNIVGLPVLFCLYGAVRWRVRRASRLRQKLGS